MTTTATIADIARHAGVGTATVDRVINGRSGVNAETMRKVMGAITELGKPTVLRGRPRMRENLHFAYVLPDIDSPFVGQVERQIAQAAGDFRHQHITEVTHRFSVDDPAQFAASLANIGECDGIAVLAPDLPIVKQAINEKIRAGVHVVTLFSDVAGSMRQAYVGVDNRAAGRTAGLLLARMAGAPKRDTLLLLSQATRFSAEIERRIGFAQVIEERFSAVRMLRGPDMPADDEGMYKTLLRYLQKDVDANTLAGIYCVGTGSAGVAQALAELGLTKPGLPPSPGLAAHDFTDAHHTLLTNGAMAYVLHQDIHYCVSAAARVLRGLCDNVRGALSVVQPRVEILTAENLH
jgi:LacI family transcriptional regulator